MLVLLRDMKTNLKREIGASDEKVERVEKKSYDLLEMNKRMNKRIDFLEQKERYKNIIFRGIEDNEKVKKIIW